MHDRVASARGLRRRVHCARRGACSLHAGLREVLLVPLLLMLLLLLLLSLLLVLLLVDGGVNDSHSAVSVV